jgi:hypothetical protein
VTKAQIQAEEPWQETVTKLLGSLGIKWMHVYPLRTKHGWRTPTSGPLAKGWPDLIGVKGDWWYVIEVKGETTVIEPDQLAVLSHFAGKPYTLVWVIRPTDDLQQIAHWLAAPGTAPPIFGWSPTVQPMRAQRPTRPR